ncbi:hypothetical protein [Tunturiibacter psychrotolerans]|uniref:hypothetical protein n=1 Tax=Tunturiibacter psychrotolerans TaxID=3069686 RepID=UPI003D21A6A1
MTNNDDVKMETLLLNGESIETTDPLKPDIKSKTLWKRMLSVGCFGLAMYLFVSIPAQALDLDVFEAIFGSIQNDMGKSLAQINQISQSVQKLYQTTMWPLAAINQARGFVSNSITGFRGQMTQLFNTPMTSAVTVGPQQFESILHSRLMSQIPSLHTSFATNYGSIPQMNAASPQDRVMMDIDDALSQENLKTTLISDQGGDVVLNTANQMENQVAVSTPGSNPYLTAQAQVANLRCQAYMQKMLAAELRQEAGRLAHDNVLVKRRTSSTGGIGGLISGALTNR